MLLGLWSENWKFCVSSFAAKQSNRRKTPENKLSCSDGMALLKPSKSCFLHYAYRYACIPTLLLPESESVKRAGEDLIILG